MGRTAPTHLKRTRLRACGFTLPEVIIAASILALFIVGSVSAMAQINRWAAVSRLRTLALAVAQQKVDQIMSTPWSVLATTPTVLTAGTVTENNLPLNNDNFNNESGLSSAFSGLDTPITATRTTVIASLSTRQVRGSITVTYSYRGRNYSVSMNTLRTTDDF